MKKPLATLLCLLMVLALAPISHAEEPITLTIFIDHFWYPVETFTGIIPEEITRLTGIVLEPTIALDQEQLGVLIGSGDMPDLVYTQNLCDQMSNPDIAYSIEDLIAEYDVDWDISAKQLGIARGLSEDGKAYTILNHYSEKADWEGSNAVPMVGSAMYRTDLWEQMGKPPMTTFDELFDVLVMAKEQFPDLAAALKVNQNWNTLTTRFLCGMGQLDFIAQEDGTYIHYTQDPRYKEMLSWFNKCWNAGLISPDESYFIAGSTAVPTGSWFMSLGCTQNMLPGALSELQQLDPSYGAAELVPFAESDFATSDIGWSGVFITKANKNVEASIKFLAWMFTPEAQKLTQMGREGIEYELNEQGLPVFSAEWIAALNDGTHNNVYNPWFYLGGSEIVEADSRVAPTDPALVAEAYTVMRERFDNMPWVKAAEPIGTSDEKVILEKIKEMIKTYERNMIMAENDEAFEKLYDEYLTNAQKTGIDTLNAYMTEKINEIMPLYQ